MLECHPAPGTESAPRSAVKLQKLLRRLHEPEGGKIVVVVADGLGGLGREPGGPTELQAARLPHLDQLAREGTTGLADPVCPGVTPGSGPGHLALFGYDPVEQLVGRGVLAALGVEFPLNPGDVAARGNFCTVDEQGRVVDRRAGRLSDEEGRRLTGKLREAVQLEGVQLFFEPVQQYRFVVVMRGTRVELSPDVTDSDPHCAGVEPRAPEPLKVSASKTADLVRKLLSDSAAVLADEERANMVLLRGFSSKPNLPKFEEVYGLSALAVASYPMYRGLASLLGMEVASAPAGLEAAVRFVEEHWASRDFFFLHHKDADSAGEDGDFEEKVRQLERLDRVIPALRELDPAVLVVTGDHSTPARLAAHSWHPVPVALHASTCRTDHVESFDELACAHGGLGRFPAQQLMALALGHAGRLRKYGP